MKNTVNSTIIRNRYNVLPDEATHEKAVLLSLLIHCNIPYHMNNGRVVLDSKKGLKLADIKAYYDKYNDSEVLAILIDSDIWYTVSDGKLTYTAAPAPAPAPEKKIACKTKAEKLTDDTEIKRVEVVTLDEKKKMRIIWTAVYTIGKLNEVVSYFLKSNKPEEFWLYETESGRGMKLLDYARVHDIKPIKKSWEVN